MLENRPQRITARRHSFQASTWKNKDFENRPWHQLSIDSHLDYSLFIRKSKARTMGDELPVPAQLETQLGKCKTVRASDFYKPRTKTDEVGQTRRREQHKLPPWLFCIRVSPGVALMFFLLHCYSYRLVGNESIQGKASASSSCSKVISNTNRSHDANAFVSSGCILISL